MSLWVPPTRSFYVSVTLLTNHQQVRVLTCVLTTWSLTDSDCSQILLITIQDVYWFDFEASECLFIKTSFCREFSNQRNRQKNPRNALFDALLMYFVLLNRIDIGESWRSRIFITCRLSLCVCVFWVYVNGTFTCDAVDSLKFSRVNLTQTLNRAKRALEKKARDMLKPLKTCLVSLSEEVKSAAAMFLPRCAGLFCTFVYVRMYASVFCFVP